MQQFTDPRDSGGFTGVTVQPQHIPTDTALIVRYGGKEAAIILSVAVLVLAVAQLLKAVIPEK